MAWVWNAKGERREVRDLGYVLRRAASADAVLVKRAPAVGVLPLVYDGTRHVHVPESSVRDDAILVVRFGDGTTFVSYFASASVLLDWLQRPSLRGVPLCWFGLWSECGVAREARGRYAS